MLWIFGKVAAAFLALLGLIVAITLLSPDSWRQYAEALRLAGEIQITDSLRAAALGLGAAAAALAVLFGGALLLYRLGDRP